MLHGPGFVSFGLGLSIALAAACGRPVRRLDQGAEGHEASSAGNSSTDRRGSYPTLDVAPLAGWPKWLGDANHQISGLAFRDGHLYAVSDQSGAETRALLEIELDPEASSRRVGVHVLCRWQGGPHPYAEGLAIDPAHGRPRIALMPLESRADTLIEVGFDDCALLGTYGPLTGKDSNQGIEGAALSPDGQTLFLVHETERTLLSLRRGKPGPARVVAKIEDAESLCDAAYDDRGTAPLTDDRLLLLDRNAQQIFAVTLSGKVACLWHLSKRAVRRDPDGVGYTLVALEGLAIESREPDGSLLDYAATDSPPKPLPYHPRKGREEKGGPYEKRVGMLYRFRLPPLESPSAELRPHSDPPLPACIGDPHLDRTPRIVHADEPCTQRHPPSAAGPVDR